MNKASDPAAALLELQNRSSPHHFWNSPQTLLLLSAIIVLVVLLFLWAAYIRKPKHRASPNQIIDSPTSKTSGRSRRRRKSKQRNPTLAETGGLPPRKPDGAISNPN